MDEIMIDSKKISKVDEASKQFIIDVLEGNQTHGIDIECIYYNQKKIWIVIEFCKCDTLDPFSSHPNNYPFNWRKFVTLFEISQKLGGELWIINYSLKEQWRNNIRLLNIRGVDYALVNQLIKSQTQPRGYVGYLKYEDNRMSLTDFKSFFKDLNNKASNVWEDKL